MRYPAQSKAVILKKGAALFNIQSNKATSLSSVPAATCFAAIGAEIKEVLDYAVKRECVFDLFKS
jgi:hypothetical protein